MIHEIHPTTGVIHVNWRRRAVDKSPILGLELGFVRLVGLWLVSGLMSPVNMKCEFVCDVSRRNHDKRCSTVAPSVATPPASSAKRCDTDVSNEFSRTMSNRHSWCTSTEIGYRELCLSSTTPSTLLHQSISKLKQDKTGS